MTLTNSTVSGNSAARGGGVVNGNGGTVTLTNSTVSGNSAASYGGGVLTGGTETFTRTLISGNTAPVGAEVDNIVTVTADNFNLFGHSGLTNAQAFDGFTPGASDITPPPTAHPAQAASPRPSPTSSRRSLTTAGPRRPTPW